MTIAANEKPVSGKLWLVSTKLVQDELPLGSSKDGSLEDSSDQDDNDVKLPFMKEGKRLGTASVNGKPVSGKLLSTSTKLALGIRQDVKANNIFILKTG